MNPAAQAVNGISDAELASEPKFYEIIDEVCEWLADSDLAGYNSAKFDLPMLAEEIERVKAAFPEKNIPAESAAGVIAHGTEEADMSPEPGGGDGLVIGFAAGFDENAFRGKGLAGGVKMVCSEEYGFAAKADGADHGCFRLHNRHLTGAGCGGRSGR